MSLNHTINEALLGAKMLSLEGSVCWHPQHVQKEVEVVEARKVWGFCIGWCLLLVTAEE